MFNCISDSTHFAKSLPWRWCMSVEWIYTLFHSHVRTRILQLAVYGGGTVCPYIRTHAYVRMYVCISLYSTVHVWGLHWFEILHGWTGNVPTVLFRNTSDFNSTSPFLHSYFHSPPHAPLPISILGCKNRQPRLCGRGRWDGSSRLPQAHPAVHGGLSADWPPTWPGTQLAQGVQCGPEVRGQPNSRLVGGAEGCVMCWWLCAVPERAVIGWHALYVRKSTGVCSSTCCTRVSVLVCPCAPRPLIYVCTYIHTRHDSNFHTVYVHV